MKTLLKVNGIYGLFLWIDYGVAKLVVTYRQDGAKAGTVYDEDTNVWANGTYIHYWDYGNETLDEAIKFLEKK